MKQAFIVVVLLVMASPVYASGPDPLAGVASTPSAGLLRSGLLDLSRLQISHSLSFASTSSSLYGHDSGGLWVTRFGYRVSNPLQLSMDLGATINTSGDGPVLSEKNLFLRGFEMNYRPSNLFQLNIAYRRWPGGAGNQSLYDLGSGPWGSPLGSVR